MTDEQTMRLAGALASQDPSTGLEAVWALRRLIDRAERIQVDNARTQGWSWQAIADALHVSRQAVHEKHAMRRKVMNKEA
jgi:hypothetical protein